MSIEQTKNEIAKKSFEVLVYLLDKFSYPEICKSNEKTIKVKPFLEKTLQENDKYIYKLDDLLENEKIQRIGLIGPYGSGKSSILTSLKETHITDRKYLTLSAIDFGSTLDENELNKFPNNEKISEKVAEKISEKLVEKKSKQLKEIRKILVNQIISDTEKKVKKNKDYQLLINQLSHYNSSKKFEKYEKAAYVSGICIVVISLFMIPLLKYKYVYTAFFRMINEHKIIFCIIAIAMVGLLIYCSYKFINFLSGISIKSLKVAGNSLEKSNSIEASFLDNDVEAIIKLLELYEKNVGSKSLVVIIEDIDRYGSKELFLELYHISTICTTIKFVFAMSSDIFASNELSKYFNAIIDIIPFNDKATLEKEIVKSLDSIKGTTSEPMFFNVKTTIVFKILPFISDFREAIRIQNKYIINLENYAKFYEDIYSEESKNLRTSIYTYTFLETKFPKEINNYSSSENPLKILTNKIEQECSTESTVKQDLDKKLKNKEQELHECKTSIEELKTSEINDVLKDSEDYLNLILAAIRCSNNQKRISGVYKYGRSVTYNEFINNPALYIETFLNKDILKDFNNRIKNSRDIQIERLKQKIEKIKTEQRMLKSKLDDERNRISSLEFDEKANFLREEGKFDDILTAEDKILEKLIIDLFCGGLLDNKWEFLISNNLQLSKNELIEKEISHNLHNDISKIKVYENYEPTDAFLEKLIPSYFRNSSLCCHQIFSKLLKEKEYKKLNELLTVFIQTTDESLLKSFNSLSQEEVSTTLSTNEIDIISRIEFFLITAIYDDSKQNDELLLELLNETDIDNYYSYKIEKYIDVYQETLDYKVLDYVLEIEANIKINNLEIFSSYININKFVENNLYTQNIENLLYVCEKEMSTKELNVYEIIKDEQLEEVQISTLNSNIYKYEVEDLQKVLQILKPHIEKLSNVHQSNKTTIITGNFYEISKENIQFIFENFDEYEDYIVNNFDEIKGSIIDIELSLRNIVKLYIKLGDKHIVDGMFRPVAELALEEKKEIIEMVSPYELPYFIREVIAKNIQLTDITNIDRAKEFKEFYEIEDHIDYKLMLIKNSKYTYDELKPIPYNEEKIDLIENILKENDEIGLLSFIEEHSEKYMNRSDIKDLLSDTLIEEKYSFPESGRGSKVKCLQEENELKEYKKVTEILRNKEIVDYIEKDNKIKKMSNSFIDVE